MSDGSEKDERPGEYVIIHRRRRRAMRVPLDEVPRRSLVVEESQGVSAEARSGAESEEPTLRPTFPDGVPAAMQPSSPVEGSGAVRSDSGSGEPSDEAAVGALPSIEIPLEAPSAERSLEEPGSDAGGAQRHEDEGLSLDTVEERLPELPGEPTSPGGQAPSVEPEFGGLPAVTVSDPEPGDLPGTLDDSGEEAEPLELDEADAVQGPVPPPPPPARPSAPRPPEPPARSSAPAPSPSPSAQRPKKGWFEEYFDDDYLRTVPPLPRRAVERQCDFLVASLGLAAGQTVLDVGCGLGLQAIELARRGLRVVAMDVSLAMLARAAEEAQEAALHINFLHADMREMDFDAAFDAVLCLGTTFGYFDDESNAQVLGRFRQALKPGGRLMLDVVNRDHVLARQPNLIWFEGDGCVCMEETDFNFLTSRLVVKRTLMFDDGQQRLVFSSVRLYALHELGRLMHGQGFRVTSVSGMEATPGAFLGAVSPRILMVAQRPEDTPRTSSGTVGGRQEVSGEQQEPPPTVPGDVPVEEERSEIP